MSQLLECYGEREEKIVREWHNPNIGYFYTAQESLYRGKTRFQKIELLKTAHFGHVLLLDDCTQVAEKGDWQYHEPMAHYPLLAHPNPKDVLVIGGGDGGILREILLHPSVERVDFVELDEEVVAFAKEYLVSINQNAFENPKVHLFFTDGRAYVENTDRRYDVVIMDMTDPFGPSRMLYTQEFFAHIKAIMKDERALFTMHSESPLTRPAAYECIRKTVASVFDIVRNAYTYIEMYATFWSFCVASMKSDIQTLSEEEIATRMQTRALPPLHLLTEKTWHSMQVEYPYIAALHKNEVPLITDSNPDFPDHFLQEDLAPTQ